MIFNLIKLLIGKLSQEDKEKIKIFLEEVIKAAAAGAIQGAAKR